MDYNSTQKMGMRLLRKGKKGMFRVVFSRGGLFLILLLIQIIIPFYMLYGRFSELTVSYYWFTVVFYVGAVIYLINTNMDNSAKITWLILIMIIPVFGIGMLVYTKLDIGHRASKRRVEFIAELTRNSITQDQNIIEEIKEISPETYAISNYIKRDGCYPVYTNTDINYYPDGLSKFRQLLTELEKAEHFIFLEYFIIEEGIMWGQVLDILARKAAEGVEIRLMYDGTCEFTTLPHDYPKRLQKLGIQCKMFAPATPFISAHYNYRDHRKIVVIDGHTAFTGGINLADEYINHVEKHGHWKDTAIMLKGDAVKSFTLMFLHLWNIDEKTLSISNFEKYLRYPTLAPDNTRGYVIPYGDCPLDEEKCGEMVYMDILNRAERYVHIMTPYLILDGEMETALKFAAERGVDVTIIMPGIPDKKMANALAKTHYKTLIDSGVKIYEYTPGFVHAKVFVSDDIKAVVGTINLDYRSLYHHFECAAYMYDAECIDDIELDFQNTLKKCRKVTHETIRKERLIVKFRGQLLKAFAPLL